ncbi:MAG: phosphodiester glycosidase family protein [Actinobacteria bacterium]|nr:phosphodiester glycosidase family protein [Actinomycetota bacterium]
MKHKTKPNSITFYFLHFMICMLVFLSFFAIIFIYHGPFVKLKYDIVAMSMATKSNKYFATWFLSKGDINNILAKTNSVVRDDKENLSNIKVQKDNTVQSDSTNQVLESQNSKEMQVKDITGINIIDITGTNFKGKLMEVSDPSKVTLGLAPKLGQVGAPLSEIVNIYKAIGGINAGGFLDDNLTGTGAKPDGIVIENGKIKFIQNGLKTFSVIGFSNDNILVISNSMDLDQINNSNLRCAISFGPALILNGKPLVKKGGTYLAPRSAIAQKKDGTILLLVIDGRQLYSYGANYMDVQDIFLKYGAYNAANLDGGSSATLNYQGKTINRPCDITGERSIPSAFLVMP